jgi:YfiH family protein
MIRKKAQRIEWLEFELLAEFPHLIHAVLLSHGGYSPPPFDSLNMGYNSHFSSENSNVELNREKVKKILNIDFLRGCSLEHKDRIVDITASNKLLSPLCDALSTQEKDIALTITHADCQAAIFYDPVQQAIANVHAGWRGNVQNIYAKTVSFMKSCYASSPANLHVCISPSLSPAEAEFINYRQEFPESFWQFQIKPYYFDLWALAKSQLLEAGILPHHIQLAQIGTLSNPHDYFSYRREKLSGRHGTLIALKNS